MVTYSTTASIVLALQNAPPPQWITTVCLVLILFGLWSHASKNLSKLVSKPGGSSNATHGCTEDHRPSMVVNVAAMDRLEGMLSRLFGANKETQGKDEVNGLLERFTKLMDSLERTRRAVHFSDETLLKEEVAALSGRIDHLTMLFLAQPNAEESKERDTAHGNSDRPSRKDEDHIGQRKVPVVHAVHAWSSQGNKRRPRADSGSEGETSQVPPLTAEDLIKYAGKSLDQVIQDLQRRTAETQVVERAPEHLTELEKEIGKKSLAALARQWKMAYKGDLNPGDYLEIGVLTDEQTDMPRRLIQELIRVRKRADLIQRLISEGKKILDCQTCGRIVPANKHHACVRTGLTVGTRKGGVPGEKRMIVSQTGRGGIHITQQAEVDTKRLNVELQKLRQFQIMEEERAKATIPEAARVHKQLERDVAQAETSDTECTEPVVMVDDTLAPSLVNAVMRGNFPQAGDASPPN